MRQSVLALIVAISAVATGVVVRPDVCLIPAEREILPGDGGHPASAVGAQPGAPHQIAGPSRGCRAPGRHDHGEFPVTGAARGVEPGEERMPAGAADMPASDARAQPDSRGSPSA